MSNQTFRQNIATTNPTYFNVAGSNNTFKTVILKNNADVDFQFCVHNSSTVAPSPVLSATSTNGNTLVKGTQTTVILDPNSFIWVQTPTANKMVEATVYSKVISTGRFSL